MVGKNSTSKLNPYLRQQIVTAGPNKLVLMLYDLGLKSCRANDRQKAAKVLVELIAALNFDHQEIAVPLFEQYRFALDQVHKGKFEYPEVLFQELRTLWETQVIGQQEARVVQ